MRRGGLFLPTLGVVLAGIGVGGSGAAEEKRAGSRPTEAATSARAAPTSADIRLPLELAAVAEGAKDSRRIGLDEVVDRALEQNLEFALARVEEELAHAQSFGALGRLAPRLEVGAGAHRTDGRVQGSFGELRDVDFDTIEPRLGVAYRLNLGARIADALAARRASQAAGLATLEARQRLLLRLTELYQDLLFAEAGVEIAQRRVRDGEAFLNIVAARQRTGLELASEVARARSKLLRDRQELAQSRALWAATSARLAVALRLPPEVLLVSRESELAPRDLVPSPVESQVLADARRRPRVRALRLEAAAADLRSDAAWWELAGPELDARVSETTIGESTGDLEDRTNLGVFLGWTLSLDQVAKLSERRADRATARLEALRAEIEAAGEARRILAELEATRESLPLAWEGLQAAEHNRRISLARFRSGTAIALEVLDAEERLAEARLALARTIVEYNVAQARLLAATGAIHEEQLLP